MTWRKEESPRRQRTAESGRRNGSDSMTAGLITDLDGEGDGVGVDVPDAWRPFI